MSIEVDRRRADEIAARIELGPITVRRYFGGVSLVAGKIQFAIVMCGRLYLRVDDRSRAALRALGGKPFTYRGQGKAVVVASYYEAPSAVLDDPNQLTEFAIQAHRTASAARRTTAPNLFVHLKQ
ncbi:MAG: TfoX/Sxy family protein [Acidobacteriaceae bacterium]